MDKVEQRIKEIEQKYKESNPEYDDFSFLLFECQQLTDCTELYKQTLSIATKRYIEMKKIIKDLKKHIEELESKEL